MKQPFSSPVAIADIRSELLTPVNVAPLDPGVVGTFTERAVRQLLREGDAENTLRSYRSALRYWAAWFALRYHAALELPVPSAVVLQFIVDHVQRSTAEGLTTDLPAVIDRALVERGFKAQLGAPALSTVLHRISVLSKVHQLQGLPNPAQEPVVRELLAKTRRAYAKRGAVVQKKPALTKEPLEALLATCDGSLRGLRDRALLLFAWASGGRRRSEVTAATTTNLVRQLGGDYVYLMGHSKTSQDGGGHAASANPVGGRAAQALDAWLAASKIVEGAAFRRIRRGDVLGEALSPAAVRDIIKTRCASAGLAQDFSAHSIRSGFVTEAGRHNVPLADAMAMTGHASTSAILGYFRQGQLSTSLAARLLDGPSTTEPPVNK
ncbi:MULTISPECIES: site-specific integrase [unclassified Duganella]|uniref:site-specific integrase n=1 Tax=unclassified Duganella TaxID=2636909 RepID=UPI000892C230|nr:MULTISPECIES: site-specific integrase [unclassified Duganella]OEZ63868.1 tyrosine recombinase XerC [Duganella sp. HH105]OFA06979.1 tyrosine recombinase XerC [Duganella sp. HH101]